MRERILPMSNAAIFGILSGLLSAVSYPPYVAAILRGKARPERASWLIWSVLTAMGFFGQLAVGATHSLWLPGVQAVGVIVVFLLSIRYGFGGLLRRDLCTLAAAALVLLAWFFTKNALLAVCLIILIDGMGGWLSVIKAYEHPESETVATWALSGAAGACALLALEKANAGQILYPLYILLMNAAVVAAILLGRKKAGRGAAARTPVRAIGFDWGGVIFQRPGPSLNDALAAFLGTDPTEFKRAYFRHNHLVNKGADSKVMEEATEMWGAILAELGRAGELDAVMEFVRSRPPGAVSGEMMDLVAGLRRAGWKVGLLSNNSGRAAREFRSLGYDAQFDASLFSAEIGPMKPEPAAFQLLADALGVRPDEMVFIDDSEKSLSTAGEVGYVPILFTDIGALVARLRELGIDA